MYTVGTILLYERRGVYKVADVGTPPMREEDTGLYYKLLPVFDGHNEIMYIPVDTTAFMRPLIGEQKALEYLELFAQMSPQSFSSRRMADLSAHYRAMLASFRLEDCLLLLKELYVKQRELSGRGRKLGQLDVQYLKMAERLICEEFAAVLRTGPEEIKKRLSAAMRAKVTA